MIILTQTNRPDRTFAHGAIYSSDLHCRLRDRNDWCPDHPDWLLCVGLAYARSLIQTQPQFEYIDFRRKLGQSVILGLEFLIAGDIIRTVIVAESLENVLILGLIILIRSFLTVTLHLEIEGHWPWQPAPNRES